MLVRRIHALFIALCTCAGVSMLAVPAIATPAVGQRAVYREAPLSPDGPSGIGLAKTGPRIIASSALYARALTSSDWTITPNGMVYRGCVYELPKSTIIDSADGKLLLPSGATQPVSACPYATIVPSGAKTAAGKVPVRPEANAVSAGRTALPALNSGVFSPQYGGGCPCGNYTTFSSWTPGIYNDWVNYLSDDYQVPTAPSANAGQSVFMFSAFEDGAGDSILQPVLGYGPVEGNSGVLLGGNYLWIFAYYAWSGNVFVTGDPQQVKAGQQIDATISASSCNPGGTNCHWYIDAYDINNGADSNEVAYSDPVYTTVFGGALEDNATHCNQLFANGHLVFRNIVVEDKSGSRITPPSPWNVYGNGGCGVSEPTSSTSADILYQP
jgi:hypothetical protein